MSKWPSICWPACELKSPVFPRGLLVRNHETTGFNVRSSEYYPRPVTVRSGCAGGSLVIHTSPEESSCIRTMPQFITRLHRRRPHKPSTTLFPSALRAVKGCNPYESSIIKPPQPCEPWRAPCSPKCRGLGILSSVSAHDFAFFAGFPTTITRSFPLLESASHWDVHVQWFHRLLTHKMPYTPCLSLCELLNRSSGQRFLHYP